MDVFLCKFHCRPTLTLELPLIHEFEFQLASMNRRLNCSIETVFLTPAENHIFVSASLVKEIGKLGGNVSQFVHPLVYDALTEKFDR